MLNQPTGTVISWSAFAGHIAVGAAVGIGAAGAALSQAAPTDEQIAILLRLSLYIGGLLGLAVWGIQVGQEKTRREVARLRKWRWNEPLRRTVADRTEESPPRCVKHQLLPHLSYGARTGFACGTVEAALRIFWGDGRWLPVLLSITAAGMAGGVLVWLVRIMDADSRSTGVLGGDPLGGPTEPQGHSVSFETRLAGFLHCDVADIRQAAPRPVSKMAFWSVVDFGSYIGPKPVQLIREFLERIRATVHGMNTQNGQAGK